MTPRTIRELESNPRWERRSLSVCRFCIDPEWTVEDERQLSYTSIVSLAECVREHHWNLDLASHVTPPLTTISKSVAGTFRAPIWVDSIIDARWTIDDVTPTSYRLVVDLSNAAEPDVVSARVEVELVFIIDGEPRRTEAPAEVTALLNELASR